MYTVCQVTLFFFNKLPDIEKVNQQQRNIFLVINEFYVKKIIYKVNIHKFSKEVYHLIY